MNDEFTYWLKIKIDLLKKEINSYEKEDDFCCLSCFKNSKLFLETKLESLLEVEEFLKTIS